MVGKQLEIVPLRQDISEVRLENRQYLLDSEFPKYRLPPDPNQLYMPVVPPP
jgi:hypothetical protein